MNKKIKILYLITGLKTGGAEVVLYNLVKSLDRRKFEPIVVSVIPIAEIGKKIQALGAKILSLNARFKYNPFIFFRLISILKKEKPQILHSHLFHAIFLGRVTGRICKVPIIISSIHSKYIGGFLRNRLLQITDRLDDVVTIVSQRAAETIIKSKTVSANKLLVIYNGIDLNKFIFQDKKAKEKVREELNFKKDAKILISVGRLFRAKGYSYLIEAIKILKKNLNIRLLILGEGEDKRKLETQIRDFNLEKNIFLLGREENVSDYLNTSNIFILASLWEGLPIALLEAMACGLPAVATNVGGTSEIIEDGVSGFLVEPKNSLTLAKKIEYLLSLEPGKRREMGMEGRKIVEEKFSLGKMARNYENLYEKLLSKMK